MRLYRLMLALLVLISAPCIAAVTYVQSTGSYNTSTTCFATVLTPTVGDDLVFAVETHTAGATFSSVASSVGPTPITDYPFAISGSYNFGYGVFRLHNVTAVSQNITVTFSGATECFGWLIETSPVGSLDQVAAVTSGTASPFLTNSIVPASNGALLLAIGGASTAVTFSAWTNSFTVLPNIRTAGPTMYAAYLDQATSASVAAGATISASANWSGLLLDYIPPATILPRAIVMSNGKVLVGPNGAMVVQ